MTESKETSPEVFYGIRYSDLTDEIISGILDLYFETAKTPRAPWKTITLDRLADQLKYSESVEFRFGSEISGDSKIEVLTEKTIRGENNQTIDRIVTFAFDPNIETKSRASRQKAIVIQAQFKKLASDYLLQTGLGVVLMPE